MTTLLRIIWKGRYRIILAVWAMLLLMFSASVFKPDPAMKADRVTDGVGGDRDHRVQGVQTNQKIRVGHAMCFANMTECECLPGYIGKECEEATCEQGCLHGQCLRPGYCTCEEGWKGRSCDEAICSKSCIHGKCLYPDFCHCDTGWFGRRCNKPCNNGEFSQRDQTCKCYDGWAGLNCGEAQCERHGCYYGHCSSPNECTCDSAWTGLNCTTDLIKNSAEAYVKGLSYKSKRWPALTVYKSSEFDETWRYIRKWTGRLPEEWKFGRTRFSSELPLNDTLINLVDNKHRACVAVGNSGGLNKAKAGMVINAHEAVLRYNDGPTKGYEEFVGTKTTYRILNRKFGESLIQQKQIRPPPPPVGKRKSKPRKPPKMETTLLWRAESYQQYTTLKRLIPNEPLYILSPQFLIPLFTFYKEVIERMVDDGITWKSTQSTPHGFVGIAFLMQICDRVTAYGFDPPKSKHNFRYHYYNKLEPLDPHTNDFEFNMLRLLDAVGAIRLCTTERLERCIGEDEVHFGIVK